MAGFDFSTRHIRYFVCTAELGQVSLAAQELNITQSAITTAIKQLEQKLQTQLFIRQASGMLLTGSGQSFLNHCYDILNSVSACQDIRHQGNEVEGVLRVAATYTVMGYFLPYHVQRLQRLYPHIVFSLHELPRVHIEEGLLCGELDVGVLLSSNVHNPQLSVFPFLHSARHLWVGQQHRLLQQEQVDFDDLVAEPYIVLTVDEASDTARAYWQQNHFSPNIILQTSSIEAVRSMVANGQGVSILSDAVHRPWSLEGRRINRIKLTSPVPPMSLGVAVCAQRAQSVAQQVFCDYFVRRMG